MIVFGLVALTATGMPAAGASAQKLSGPPTNVQLLRVDHPDRDCAGDHDTLTWDPPKRTGGHPLLGYHIEQFEEGTNPPRSFDYDVGPDVTALDVTPHIAGFIAFWVFPITSAGWGDRGSYGVSMDGVPSPQSFDFTYDLDVLTLHSITTSASWFAETKVPGMGGNPADSTVTIKMLPDGPSVSYQAQFPGIGVPVKFAGLPAGVTKSFSVVVANACGSSSGVSAGFTNGRAPQWFHNSPPTSVPAGGEYHYRFHASGIPEPTLSLSFDAPSWLHFNPATGIVHGRPPAGIKSFSYVVFAHSDFGFALYEGSFLDSGTVTVDVT